MIAGYLGAEIKYKACIARELGIDAIHTEKNGVCDSQERYHGRNDTQDSDKNIS